MWGYSRRQVCGSRYDKRTSLSQCSRRCLNIGGVAGYKCLFQLLESALVWHTLTPGTADIDFLTLLHREGIELLWRCYVAHPVRMPRMSDDTES